MNDGNLPPQNSTPCGPGMPGGRQHHPLANYQFSPEEQRVLRECNTESFFQRSLPIGTGFGLAAYYGVKQGFLSPNQRFGSVPKIVVGVVIGYFVGKLSYQRKCAEKLIQLPNSKIGEILKQRKKGGLYGTLSPDQGLGAGLSLAPFATPNADVYSDEEIRGNRINSLDLDTERPSQPGLDDGFRLTLDSPPVIVYEDNLPNEPPKQTVTYDELRKKNREEYLKKSQASLYRPIAAPETPPAARPERVSPEPEGQKNRYGDVWSQ